MPQVHHKLSMGLDSSAFNKTSPFLAAYNLAEQSRRRVKVMNGLDRRICNVKLQFFEKEERIHHKIMEQVKARLVDSLQKRLAYKLVLKKHPIAHAKNYKKALDGEYTYQALQHEVNDMMKYMRPEYARERRAKALIDINRKKYDNVISENNKTMDGLCPSNRRWKAVGLSDAGAKDDVENKENETKEKIPVPELTVTEKKQKMGLAGLRRRLITLDDSKSPSPAKSPTKSPTKMPPLKKAQSTNSMIAGGRRQGITMSMMKKQQTFLSNKEKTEIQVQDSTDAGATTKPVEDTNLDINTSRADETEKRVSIDLKTNDAISSSSERPMNRTEEWTQKHGILPPIKPHERQISNILTNDTNIGQSITASVPAKLPALKLVSNIARKEIEVC